MNTFYIAIVIVILAILGFNVFHYLAQATQFTAQGTKVIGEDVLKTGEVVAGGVLGGAVGAVEGGVEGSIKGARNVLHRELDISPDEIIQNARDNVRLTSYHPSRTELSKKKLVSSEDNEKGYCLIGTNEDELGNPRRACIRVGVNDKCGSNKIFPTMAVCINPSLRA